MSTIANNKLTFSAACALALMLVQLAVIRWAPSGLLVRCVLPATIALAPLALWPHRTHIGVWVMFVGFAANLAVVLSNGGLMPIERTTVVAAAGAERADSYQLGGWIRGSKDVLVTADTGRAVTLGDRIVIPVGSRGLVASAGDLVIAAGIIILAAEASVAWQRRARAGGASERASTARAGGGAITLR